MFVVPWKTNFKGAATNVMPKEWQMWPAKKLSTGALRPRVQELKVKHQFGLKHIVFITVNDYQLGPSHPALRRCNWSIRWSPHTQRWNEYNKLITYLNFKYTNQRGNKIREEGGTAYLCTSGKAFKYTWCKQESNELRQNMTRWLQFSTIYEQA